jgi:integrase
MLPRTEKQMPDLPKATSTFHKLPAVDGRQTDYKDASGSRVPGLMLRVSPKAKTWVLTARLPGVKNPSRIKLGELAEMTLTDARSSALELKAQLRAGHDPQTERKERLAAAAVKRADVIDVHIASYSAFCIAHQRRGAEFKQTLQREVLPRWKGRQIASITRRDVRALVDDKAATAPVAANRLLGLLKRFFGWCAERDIIDTNPASGIKPVAKELSRDNVLTDAQLKDVWKAAGAMRPFGSIVRLLMLTAQRRDEVAGMRWSELDLDAREWVIAPARSKNGTENRVPLTDAALAVIGDQLRLKGSDFVFPSGRSPDSRSYSGFSKSKARLDEQSGVTGWTLHDLRRTAATGMARYKIAPHVVEKVLNHTDGVLGGVAGIYNRFGYDDEKRHALEVWAAHIERLESGETDDNVVQLSTG